MQLKQTFTLTVTTHKLLGGYECKSTECIENLCKSKFQSLRYKKVTAQRGARTHDPEIKSLMLYRLS